MNNEVNFCKLICKLIEILSCKLQDFINYFKLIFKK